MVRFSSDGLIGQHAMVAGFLAIVVQLSWHGVALAEQTPTNQLAVQLKDALEVRGQSADLLKPLAAVIEGYPKAKDQQRDELVSALVNALNSGVDPDALTALTTVSTSLRDPFGYQRIPTWKYGAYHDRVSLIRYLLERARNMAKDRPDAGAQWARAAILLAGNEGFQWADVSLHWIAQDWTAFVDLARLTPDQDKKAHAILTDRQRERREVSAASRAALEMTDKLIADPRRPLDETVVASLIKALQAWRITAGDHLGDQFDVLHEAFILRTIGLKRGVGPLATAVADWLTEWKRTEPEASPIRRWIDEALIEQAVIPENPRVIYVKPGDPLLQQLR